MNKKNFDEKYGFKLLEFQQLSEIVTASAKIINVNYGDNQISIMPGSQEYSDVMSALIGKYARLRSEAEIIRDVFSMIENKNS
jgi:hypothetical protein